MMLELVLTPLILAALAVLSTVVGVWDRISTRARNAVILASLLILISVMSQIVQINEIMKQWRVNTAQAKVIRDKELIINSNLQVIDEASGGATDGDLAYVLDDNNPFIYVFRYESAVSAYRLDDPQGLKLIDSRPCSDRLVFWQLKECDESIVTQLTQEMIRDLEGAAIHNGKLYLTTSQTSSTERQRSLFLEVSPDGKVLQATRNLRGAILALLNDLNVGDKSGDVEVEGLAIDKNGYAYFGFRSPLINDKALVIRTDVQQAFNETPKFESFLLDLSRDDKRYGITSLDYDRRTDEILVLGNSPSKTKKLPVVIWTWKVRSKTLQYPDAFSGDIFGEFDLSVGRAAKPEVILQPTPNRIHLFFDAEGFGGQLSLLREGRTVSHPPK